MKSSRYSVGLVVLAGAFSILTCGSVSAQTSVLEANRKLVSTGTPASPPGEHRSGKTSMDATATIDLGTAQPVTASCHNGHFDRVGLRHDQMVDIAVRYCPAVAGQRIIVEPLDGGQIIAPAKNLSVAGDGTIHFKFQAGHQPGVYQIALHNGAREIGLQFWVLDEEHPGNNLPVVNSGN